MFAKPVFPLSFLIEPHSCAFTFPSPPLPPISLIKVLFQSYVSATTRPATSIYRYWALLQYMDLGTIIQADSDATATTFHAPGAKCQNHFISARHCRAPQTCLKILQSPQSLENVSFNHRHKMALALTKWLHALPESLTFNFLLIGIHILHSAFKPQAFYGTIKWHFSRGKH